MNGGVTQSDGEWRWVTEGGGFFFLHLFDLFHIVHFFFFFDPKVLTGWKILKMEKLKTTSGNLFNHTQDPWDVS